MNGVCKQKCQQRRKDRTAYRYLNAVAERRCESPSGQNLKVIAEGQSTAFFKGLIKQTAERHDQKTKEQQSDRQKYPLDLHFFLLFHNATLLSLP